MIKGVTKNIIEINPRGNDYYDKVIIILKESPNSPNEEELRRCIDLLLSETPPSITKSRSLSSLKLLIAALIGAVISASACLTAALFV